MFRFGLKYVAERGLFGKRWLKIPCLSQKTM